MFIYIYIWSLHPEVSLPWPVWPQAMIAKTWMQAGPGSEASPNEEPIRTPQFEAMHHWRRNNHDFLRKVFWFFSRSDLPSGHLNMAIGNPPLSMLIFPSYEAAFMEDFPACHGWHQRVLILIINAGCWLWPLVPLVNSRRAQFNGITSLISYLHRKYMSNHGPRPHVFGLLSCK